MKLSDEFIQKIARCHEEEELDIYTLTLYSMDSADMGFFSEKDREQVRRIFRVLMEDTRRHSDLLRLIIEMGER